jgi:hypothetical protein
MIPMLREHGRISVVQSFEFLSKKFRIKEQQIPVISKTLKNWRFS